MIITDLFEYNAELLEKSKKDEEYSKIFYDKFTSAQKSIVENADIYDTLEEEKYNDYKTWMNNYRSVLVEYANFLRNCKLNPNKFKKSCPIELFKGSLDSLRYQFPNLRVYSKYATTFNIDNKKLDIIPNDITVRHGNPAYKLLTESGSIIYLPTNTDLYNMFYVHNPYNKKEENMIHSLLENDKLTVIYGLFGSPDEEDIDKKIEDLRTLKKNLVGARFYEVRKDDPKLGEYHIGLLYKPNNKDRH